METYLPAVVAAAAVGLTYFMCIRPMRRGHCATNFQQSASRDDARASEIEQLRAEIAELRHDQASPTSLRPRR